MEGLHTIECCCLEGACAAPSAASPRHAPGPSSTAPSACARSPLRPHLCMRACMLLHVGCVTTRLQTGCLPCRRAVGQECLRSCYPPARNGACTRHACSSMCAAAANPAGSLPSLPGFMMFKGSSACLMPCIACGSASRGIVTRKLLVSAAQQLASAACNHHGGGRAEGWWPGRGTAQLSPAGPPQHAGSARGHPGTQCVPETVPSPACGQAIRPQTARPLLRQRLRPPTCSAGRPCSCSRWYSLPCPMPCSPVHVPPTSCSAG